MGAFSMNDVENYGSSGASNFFQLKDDGDVANVRFMYNGFDDIKGYAVHEVDVGDRRRYVNCLRAYNEPKSKCPFCEAGSMQKAKIFLALYDVDSKEVKLWDRGRKFAQKMSSICARYAKSDSPLVSHTFDIERHGKPKDTNTTYEVYETGKDDTRLEDLPEVPEVLGSIILDKTTEDMMYFLEHDCFPNNDTITSRKSDREEETDDRPTGRRTPSRRGEAF